MSFTLRSLTDPDLLAKAVHLAAREIGEPAFPDTVWQRERQRIVASIREANTKPGTIAGRAFGRRSTAAIPTATNHRGHAGAHRACRTCASFYRTIMQPCRAKVSVVGAVNRAQADQMVTHCCRGCPGGSLPAAAAGAEWPALAAPRPSAFPFASAQAHVLIGQPGYKRSDPDYFPLLVGNYVLGGGGFVSRLTNEVREKRGLSYSVYSYFSPGCTPAPSRSGCRRGPTRPRRPCRCRATCCAVRGRRARPPPN
jgi:zinc protease